MQVNHYDIAIATGLSHESALLYQAAQERNKIEVAHLTVR